MLCARILLVSRDFSMEPVEDWLDRLISLCPNGCLGTPLDKILSRVAVLEGEGIMVCSQD